MYRDEMNDERAAAELARDAAPRRLRRSAPAGEACAAEGTAGAREGDEGPRFRFFTGDRVLWIILAALAVISVLVVYSSTAKMAALTPAARTTAHFLRQQLILLVVSVLVMLVVQRIDCRIYNYLARPAYFLSVALTVAVYFIGHDQRRGRRFRWDPSSSSPPRP